MAGVHVCSLECKIMEMRKRYQVWVLQPAPKSIMQFRCEGGTSSEGEWTSFFWVLLSQRTRLPPDDCPHILGNIRNKPGDLGNDLMKDKRFGNYAGEALSQETRAFAGWPYFDFRLKRTEDMRVTVIPKRMCSYVQFHVYLVLTNGIKLFARESYTSAVIE